MQKPENWFDARTAVKEEKKEEKKKKTPSNLRFPLRLSAFVVVSLNPVRSDRRTYS